ncbi:unnamed protein product, partial [Staurois parvus]
MFYYVILVNVTFCHFQISRRSIPRTSRRLQGTEPRRQMLASAGLHFRGHCRRDIARSAGQGKCRRDRGAAQHGIPECSSGLPLVLHSGILPGRLI